jgi:hypothetical protein
MGNALIRAGQRGESERKVTFGTTIPSITTQKLYGCFAEQTIFVTLVSNCTGLSMLPDPLT